MSEKITAVNVKAGTYWVGDPCYAFDGLDHSVWMAALESADYTNMDIKVLESNHPGHEFVASNTAHGDGIYADQKDRTYPVDAGLIGVARVIPGHETPNGMHLIEFPHDFVVSYEDGVIQIGNIKINTSDDNNDEWCEECGISEADTGGLCWPCHDKEDDEDW